MASEAVCDLAPARLSIPSYTSFPLSDCTVCLGSAMLAVGAFALPVPPLIYLQVSPFILITLSASPTFLPYQPLLFFS